MLVVRLSRCYDPGDSARLARAVQVPPDEERLVESTVLWPMDGKLSMHRIAKLDPLLTASLNLMGAFALLAAASLVVDFKKSRKRTRYQFFIG